jgi:hypothetical protein
VVEVTAAVVADSVTDVVRERLKVGDELVDRLLVERGVLIERDDEVVHVGGVMLAVVNAHGAAVNEGLEGVEGIGKFGERRLGHVDSLVGATKR